MNKPVLVILVLKTLMLTALAAWPAAGQTPTANYSVTFDAAWSAQTHPTSFPPAPHFSGLIGGTHDGTVSFWSTGTLASPGMEDMAEQGAKSPLNSEIQAAIGSGQAGAIISGNGIFPSPGQVSVSFSVSQAFSRVTLVSMIAPSPDWFVGVSGLELFENGDWLDCRVVQLAAYDAGTDSGADFTSGNANTSPADPITLITGFPFSNGVPLGTFTFTRTDAPGPWTDLGGGSAGTHGVPLFVGSECPEPDNTVSLALTGALENTVSWLFVGLDELNAPFMGGTLVPDFSPPGGLFPVGTDASGAVEILGTWPIGAPPGFSIYFQHWVQDAGSPFGFAGSNGVSGRTP